MVVEFGCRNDLVPEEAFRRGAMSERVCVFVFRSPRFARGGGAVVSAAARDVVVAAFGGGGLKGEGGLQAAFGGSAFFRNDETGVMYLGVWGKRKASRFRTRLRLGGMVLEIFRGAASTEGPAWPERDAGYACCKS